MTWRNPLRRRWLVVAQERRGGRWVAGRAWTRAGAQMLRVDLEDFDARRTMILAESGGIAAWAAMDITYLIGRDDRVGGPWT